MPIKKQIAALQSLLAVIKVYYLTVCENLETIKETIQDHPIYRYFINLLYKQKLFSRKNPVIRYFYRLTGTLVEAVFLVAAIGGLTFILLYLSKMMWFLYLSTPMGNKFIDLFPDRAQLINDISGLDLLTFTAELTLSSFVICIGISAVCRFFHINYYLYHSQGFFGKLFYWGMPITAAVGYFIMGKFGFAEIELSICLALIPTYLMFFNCFKYTERVIPEVGSVIQFIIPYVKKTYYFIYLKFFNIETDPLDDNME